VTGIVHLRSGQRRLLATERVDWQSPEAPALSVPPRGALRIAALNVDNYFVTLGSRGARSELELTRQKDKLVALLSGLDADLLALTELENQEQRSLQHLFSALNEQLGAGQQYVWSEVTPPRASVLRAVLAYRPGRLRSVNPAWFQSVPSSQRPALAQTFDTGGQPFTAFVVHLKSKRCATGPLVVEPEGCGAATRLDEARELLRAIEALPPELDRDRLLLIGDFNAGSLEAPLVLLGGAGFVDLLDRVPTQERYSYVFDARADLLDHALASPGLARTLRGASIWHVNADEPASRSYSLDNPPAAYRADALRSSDHDPIVIDLAL
jgi:predicted extracellular nuclease